MNEKMCKLLKIAQDIWAVLPSLPSRERGLKYAVLEVKSRYREVAPLAGAWIEICQQLQQAPHCKVAPLAGAWIEISQTANIYHHYMVAPLAGAWIEIVRIMAQ